MTQISVTTFNCENLMMRCDWSSQKIKNLSQKITNIDDAHQADKIDAIFNVLSEDDRTLTAQALSAAQADVCCLQEVENLVTLTAFHNRYLRQWLRKGYFYRALIEGNDQRGIDVGVLSRAKIIRKKSHADKSYADLGIEPPNGYHPNERVFRRDCLEVEVEKEGKRLTVFVCHFKSMNGGRLETRPIREAEAKAVRLLIEQRFEDPASENWMAVGDFNDYFEQDGDRLNDHGLGPLINDGFAIDAGEFLEPNPKNRWTHFYSRKETYGALDHMFISPSLASRNKDATLRIVRAGQPLRAQRYEGRRFAGVGWVRPKASDHCPMSVTLNL